MAENNCKGYAARDQTGHLSPIEFQRREGMVPYGLSLHSHIIFISTDLDCSWG